MTTTMEEGRGGVRDYIDSSGYNANNVLDEGGDDDDDDGRWKRKGEGRGKGLTETVALHTASGRENVGGHVSHNGPEHRAEPCLPLYPTIPRYNNI